MAHIPWLSAVLVGVLLLAAQGLLLQLRQVERAQAAATDTIRASAARDLDLIRLYALRGDFEAIRDFLAADAGMPGLESMALVSPDGRILASANTAREGQSIRAVDDPALRALADRLNSEFAATAHRAPESSLVEVTASVPFPEAAAPPGSPAHGLFYQRRDLGPLIQPVVNTGRDFIWLTALVVLLFAIPLQTFVYLLVTRRLQRLAGDVRCFRDGARSGLFADTMNDQIGHVCGLLREVTRDVRDREEVAQRLALSLESANAGVWDWDMAGNAIHTSPQYHRMLGDEPVEGPLRLRDVVARVHPDDHQHVREHIRELATPGNDAYDVEFRMRGAASEEYTWIRSTGRVVKRGPDGEVLRMLGQHMDISARKAEEERLRVSEARMRRLFEGVAHAISVFDREGRIVMMNQVAAGYLGIPPQELVGQRLDAYLPEFAIELDGYIHRVLSTSEPVEFEERLKFHDDAHWFYSIIQPLVSDSGADDWALISSYEITRRKLVEEHARAQENRYKALVESTSAILWEANPETFQFTYVNQQAEAVSGFPVRQWIEDPDFWQNHLHPEDRTWAVEYCAAHIGQCESHSFEYRMRHADGGIVWLRDVVNVLSEGGRPIKLVGVMIDITREKSEEERFQAAFESIPVGCMVVEESGAIRLANPAAGEMFGYPPGEILRRYICDLIPSLDRGRQAIEVLVGRGDSEEISGIRKDGESFPVRLAAGEMHHGDVRTFVCSVTDLSHVKNLEAQLAQSQRMEAVGQLAGGIAHDFNNLLHVINGFVEIVRDTLPANEPVQTELEQIALAGERAAALTSQLLAFSRRQVMDPDSIDLNATVRQMVSMLERVIGEHIKLDVLTSSRLATVHADRGMIEQVLMNLCVNARDAMPDGGVLSIETENVVVNEDYSKDHLWAKPGRYVLITVTDTGCGMDEETVARVFEPFFTTKPVHGGTGLGLSTVYGIVKQHNGMINVYSEPGTGTTFKIYLPQAERLAVDVGTKITGPVPAGTETVLVVEDDAAVRKLTRRILEGAGYTVFEADNGRKAVQCFREHHQRIQLVLLDVVMPDMGGRAALDEMLKIDPGVKALFASGYSQNAIHTNFVLDQGLALLKKPYSRDELLRGIRYLLDGGPTDPSDA